MSASLRRIVAKREDREGTEDLPLMDVPSVYYTGSNNNNNKKGEERYKELDPIGFGHITSPEAKANIFSRITFWWANRLPLFASKYILEIEHLWNVLEKDNSRSVFLSVDKEWQKQKQLPKPSFGRALWKVYKWYFIRCLIFMLFSLAANMVIPELLSRLIIWTNMKRAHAPHVHPYAGWIYAGGMFVLAEIGSLCQHQAAYNCVRVGSALRVAVVTSVYRHSVRLSNKAKRNTSHGNIVNIMSNDAQRLVDVCLFLPNVIVGPIQLIVATTLLYFKMGWSTFVALGYITIAMTICFLVARRMDRYRFGIVENADARVKLTTEIIQYIKVIKLYAWENSFAQRVIQSRISEIMYMRTYNALRATVASFTSSCVPISTILMYSAYWAYGNELSAAVVFSSLSYINSLATPLNYVSPLAMQFAQVRVALTRITKFLLQEEITPVDDIHDPETNAVIKVSEADFDWDTKTHNIDGKSKYPDFTLRNLSLHLRGPQLVAVVGSIGSGKSSLITSILGEMKRLKGDLNRKGTIAYVPQQAWITNATIRENITFGYPYDEKYYNAVLDACALFSDLKILSAGDQTEIGDRGVNLSGGQKQRISVARALYTKADIYILDDPLSAVDAHVAKHMFYNAFKRILSNKLVVLVTNQLQFLPDVDYVVVLGKDGHTLCQGKFGELTSSNPEFAAMMETFGGGSQRAGEHEQESQKNGVDNISGNGELVKSEARERGSVRLRVYFEYLKSGGLIHAVFILLFYCAQIGSNSFLNWWLSYWTSNQKVTNRPTFFYFSIYAGIGGFLVLAAAIRAFLFYFYTPKASLKVHNRLFNRVILLPMSYFDVTPLGRIINRFSKDIDIIDTSLPGMLDTTVLFSINLIASLCMIVVVIPIILSIIAPCVVVYAIVQVFYRNTSREIQRIEAITRSTIFAHFSESLHGASSIRAYGCSERMIATNERLLDSNLKAYFTLQAMEQWLGVRLDLIANLVIFGTATFVILFRDGITPGEIGLALSYSLSITAFLNRATINSCDLETKMNSVERILESCELKIEHRNKKTQDDDDPNWPSTGDIQFNNFKMRYRQGLDYVLRGLTFNIRTKEKIGIVGRTGAGKSSIVLALFRLVEAAEGNIRLDNVDISQLDLHTLRSRIAIIPQDPVLFSGTLRDNLDPFHTLGDNEIWIALDHVQLRGAAERAGGLDSTVSENGDNWSVGQRQLICLCRALLRKPKILVLDEASASVDTATDNLIQKTIREEFREATILTIAHRLNTIMDSSRIIVMDNGMISEFDTPARLLDNPESHLNWLVNETGPKNAEVLRNMAYGKLIK